VVGEHRAAVTTDLRAAMRERQTISLRDVMVQPPQKKELLPVTLLLHDALLKEVGRQR
jgi:hypothetical protein